jgi:hypothetical protein
MENEELRKKVGKLKIESPVRGYPLLYIGIM